MDLTAFLFCPAPHQNSTVVGIIVDIYLRSNVPKLFFLSNSRHDVPIQRYLFRPLTDGYDVTSVKHAVTIVASRDW